MLRYIGKRIITGILIILVSVCFNFVLIRLAPGDPIRIMAGTDNPNLEMVAVLTERYGLDRSIPEQFVIFLGNVARGDLGHSFINHQPVLTLIMERLVPTLLLSFTALVIAVILGSTLGIYAARRNGSKMDQFLCGISYIFDATPGFWLGMIMMLIFASTLGWLPTSGMVNLRAQYTGMARVFDIMRHMVLPVSTLALVQLPFFFRITRSSVLHVMSEDFVTTFKATGMSRKRIFNKYVFKNAILPTVTVVGMSIAFLLAGTVLLETVFSWPGMGRLLMSSIARRDYSVLTGIYLILSVSIAVAMLVVDVLYALIDPRIKHE